MARGQEETFTNQAGRRWGPSRESPSASIIISSLSMDEVRSYCQIPNDIDFELSEGPAESTMGEEYNAVFFTWEQLPVGLRFLVSSLVKQFLHFTRAPLTYIHPNVIRVLTGWCVLNLLYQLVLSLVEVLLCLHLEASTWWPAIHVSLEPPAAIRYGTPRFAQIRGEKSDPGQGTLG